MDDQTPFLPLWASVCIRQHNCASSKSPCIPTCYLSFQQFNDPEMNKYIEGLATHWYLDIIKEIILLQKGIHALYPNKSLISSEATFMNSISFETAWEKAEKYAEDIMAVCSYMCSFFVCSYNIILTQDSLLCLWHSFSKNWITCISSATIKVSFFIYNFREQFPGGGAGLTGTQLQICRAVRIILRTTATHQSESIVLAMSSLNKPCFISWDTSQNFCLMVLQELV